MRAIDFESQEVWCNYCKKVIDTVLIDSGIGAYEYWGCKGNDVRLEEVCPLCEGNDFGDIPEDEEVCSDFVGMVKTPQDLIDRCERGDSIPIPDEFFGSMKFDKDGNYETD